MKYVIGDIHGCFETLRKLLLTLNIQKEDELYFLGDYIDRGPKSKAVLDLLMELQQTHNVTCLMGNHEYLMIYGFMNTGVANEIWMKNGGKQTLESFIDPLMSVIVPSTIDPYITWLKKLPQIINVGKYHIIHAGSDELNPMDSTEDGLLWDREYTPPEWCNIIVGHTPKTIEAIEQSLTTNKIYLDNGCVFKHKVGYGNLVALCLDTMKLTIQANIDSY